MPPTIKKHYAAAPVVRSQRKHRRDQNHRAEHKRRSQQRKIAHMVPQRRKTRHFVKFYGSRQIPERNSLRIHKVFFDSFSRQRRLIFDVVQIQRRLAGLENLNVLKFKFLVFPKRRQKPQPVLKSVNYDPFPICRHLVAAGFFPSCRSDFACKTRNRFSSMASLIHNPLSENSTAFGFLVLKR